MTKFLAIAALFLAGLNAQTRVNLTNQARAGVGTILPATCTPGQMFFKSDSLLLYTCTTVNTWTLPSGGGGGVWGGIIGTLSTQTDLQNALNAKEPTITAGSAGQYWRYDKTWATLNTTATVEGTNLYFTTARAIAAMATLYEVPLTFSTGLTRTVNTIVCNTASTSIFGCLTAADWNTFNGKQAALGFTPEQILTFGAGLKRVSNTITSDSTTQNFLTSGALTCGASTAGKMLVHTTALQYCDNAGTPTLQYAAYGSSAGVATSAAALSAAYIDWTGTGGASILHLPTTFAPTAHNLLSASHADTTAAAAVRGDGIFAIGATPTWQRLAHPSTTGGYFKWNGTDQVASSGAAAGTGACTNGMVVTENADAAPTCTTPDTTTTHAYFATAGTPAARAIVAGDLPSVPISTGVGGLASGVAAFLAAPSGANFNAMITGGGVEIPQNSKSAAYTTVLADCEHTIYHPGADTTARIWTIDSNANVAAPIGCTVTFVNDTSAGALTISITSDTLVLAGAGTTGSRTLAASGIATATKITSTRWIINGSGLT